jgi:hypothetical protein
MRDLIHICETLKEIMRIVFDKEHNPECATYSKAFKEVESNEIPPSTVYEDNAACIKHAMMPNCLRAKNTSTLLGTGSDPILFPWKLPSLPWIRPHSSELNIQKDSLRNPSSEDAKAPGDGKIPSLLHFCH